MTLCIVGFDDLVTSFVATIATGWSDPCRVVGIEVRRAVHLRVRWLIQWFSTGPQSGSHHAHVSASLPAIPSSGISPTRF